MEHLKITTECMKDDCNHTLHLLPSADVPGLYLQECPGCGLVHEAIVLTPDELAWHDLQVVNAVTPEEKAKK